VYRVLFILAISLIFRFPVFAEIDTIVIDPGHGGYDSGIKTPELKEKEVALSIARQLMDALREEGKKVFLTRKTDRHLSIAERIARTDRRAPDVFLSLHLSGSDSFAVYVTWYKEPAAEQTLKQYYSLSSRQRHSLYESRMLSSVIEETLKDEFGIKVFHREMPLPILNPIGVPAVLIEVPSEGMDYDEEVQRVAYSIAIGVLLYEQQ
jgi:N-acetylmuramoyl-L-alanine amidase